MLNINTPNQRKFQSNSADRFIHFNVYYLYTVLQQFIKHRVRTKLPVQSLFTLSNTTLCTISVYSLKYHSLYDLCLLC